jgi:hypothetical protein
MNFTLKLSLDRQTLAFATWETTVPGLLVHNSFRRFEAYFNRSKSIF